MRLVDLLNARLPMQLEQNLLVLLSPHDTVVSPAATKQAYENIEAPRKALVEIEDAGDPSHHVLAGDILSPASTDDVAAMIVDFVLRR
jgi:esterase/lipase